MTDADQCVGGRLADKRTVPLAGAAKQLNQDHAVHDALTAPGVTIPPELCSVVARALVAHLARESGRSGGLRPAPGTAALLRQLDRSAGGRAPAMLGESAHRWLLSGEASGLTGTSARQVRRLAEAGRLIARKHGRQWEVDADSARDYGREHGHHGTADDDPRGEAAAGH